MDGDLPGVWCQRNVQRANQKSDDKENYKWPTVWMTSKKSDVSDGKPEV